MDDAALIGLVSRLRRAFPRHQDLLTLFDEVDRRIETSRAVRTIVSNGPSNRKTNRKSNDSNESNTGSFDKRAYMREFMRNKRARDKAAKAATV